MLGIIFTALGLIFCLAGESNIGLTFTTIGLMFVAINSNRNKNK
jgi:hypothetical protein